MPGTGSYQPWISNTIFIAKPQHCFNYATHICRGKVIMPASKWTMCQNRYLVYVGVYSNVQCYNIKTKIDPVERKWLLLTESGKINQILYPGSDLKRPPNFTNYSLWHVRPMLQKSWKSAQMYFGNVAIRYISSVWMPQTKHRIHIVF